MVFDEAVQHLLPRRSAHQIRVGQVEGVPEQVAVGINQARVDRGAFQVLHLGTPVGVQNLVLLPHRHDGPLVDGQRLCVGACTVEAHHMAVAQHEVDRLFGPLTTGQAHQERSPHPSHASHDVTL